MIIKSINWAWKISMQEIHDIHTDTWCVHCIIYLAKKKRNTTLWIYCSKCFICFKKLKYITYFLVIEDEYLPVFFRWVTHSSAHDSFLHVALPRRVDQRSNPLTYDTHLCPLSLAPICSVSVSLQKHVFCTALPWDLQWIIRPDISCRDLLEWPIGGYLVFWNLVLNLSIANLFSGILSHNQTTFRHSNTWRNRLRLNNNNNNGEFLYSAHTMLCALHAYYPWSLDLYIHVPFQLPFWSIQHLQPFRR